MGEVKSIGTLSEKSVHRGLKNYLEPDSQKHEIKIGNYIADIVSGNLITEIQSKNFKVIERKLAYYTSQGYTVKIVHPVILIKYNNWVDPLTQEVLERRKAPMRTSMSDIFDELYKIREYLTNPKITFEVLGLEVEEYKYLDGYGENKKNRATKIDKLPTSIIKGIQFGSKEQSNTGIIHFGYEQFLSEKLPKEFNSSEYSKISHCTIKTARTTLLILTELGIVSRLGRKNRKIIYKSNLK